MYPMSRSSENLLERHHTMSISRRAFLGSSAAAVIAAGTMSKGKVFGANDKIGVCVMGLNGRGNSHIHGFQGSPDAEVVALCDADERILEPRVGQVEQLAGKKPKAYTDVRDALADPNVDVLTIATPNNWHTLATIWACQAGKDVYVEKPATHELWEGPQIVAAARKYGRVVQHGTQSRSDRTWLRDIPLLQSGEIIGPLHTARCLGYKNGNRGSIGFAEDETPPKGLHWRLWQGPATEKPYNRLYHPYTWHWFWHYGNGEIGNQGVHQMDIGAWGMNKGIPVKVYSAGGRYTYRDQAETPNTNVATFTYADGTMLVFEVRNRFTNDEAGVRVGNLFYGEGGYYVQGKGFFDTRDKPIEIDDRKYPKPESAGNWQNFLNAVKAHQPEAVFGSMEDANISCAHCHLANASYRVGRSLEFDPSTMRFKNDPEADAYIKRDYAPGFEVPELA